MGLLAVFKTNMIMQGIMTDIFKGSKRTDIVLYSGDQLVVFYGSNSWSYTRLGKINLHQDELTEMLGNSDVVINIRMEE